MERKRVSGSSGLLFSPEIRRAAAEIRYWKCSSMGLWEDDFFFVYVGACDQKEDEILPHIL
jgi:hypothetical protein